MKKLLFVLIFWVFIFGVFFYLINNGRNTENKKDENNFEKRTIEVSVESDVQNLSNIWLFKANYVGSELIVFVSKPSNFNSCKIPNKGEKVKIYRVTSTTSYFNAAYFYLPECE